MSELEKQIDLLVELYTQTKIKEKVHVDTTDIGDIMGITRLDFDCVKCGKRADFCLKLSNNQLPKGYVQSGQRRTEYCSDCLPERAKKEWNFYKNFENW